MTYSEFREEWLSETPMVSVHTSGSTGTPKAITLTKEFMRQSAWRTIRRFDLGSDSLLHSCISADTIGGKMMMVRALECGARFSCEKPSNTPLAGYDGEQLSLVSVVPSQLSYLVSHPAEQAKCLRVLVGGSPLAPSLRRQVAASGMEVYESYGMTETASHIAVRRVDARPTPFEPMPGVRVSLDSRGCLVIAFAEGQTLATNDLARVFPNGNFEILGRADGMFITGGKKVNPLEVESLLSERIAEPLLVVAQTDRKWGQRLLLLIEGPEPEDEAVEALRLKIRGVLHEAMLPKAMAWVKRLPVKASMKPDRGPFPEDTSMVCSENLRFHRI